MLIKKVFFLALLVHLLPRTFNKMSHIKLMPDSNPRKSCHHSFTCELWSVASMRYINHNPLATLRFAADPPFPCCDCYQLVRHGVTPCQQSSLLLCPSQCKFLDVTEENEARQYVFGCCKDLEDQNLEKKKTKEMQ